MNNDLDQQLRLALEGCRGEWPAISARASVSYSWLSKFVNGRIPNPGYETLKKLHAAIAPELVKRKAAPAKAEA
jgi:transcriptional regulator with XRE-family HTH domain